MVRQLTPSERHFAAVILLLVALGGIAMAALGGTDPLGVHGAIVILFAGGLLVPLLAHFHEDEPDPGR